MSGECYVVANYNRDIVVCTSAGAAEEARARLEAEAKEAGVRSQYSVRAVPIINEAAIQLDALHTGLKMLRERSGPALAPVIDLLLEGPESPFPETPAAQEES